MRKIRILLAALMAMALMVALPLAVQAQAAIVSFTMDRTQVQIGQSITVTVQTNLAASHVFAEVGGLRTQGIQPGESAGVRTWVITLHPAAAATEIRVFANTSASISGAISLTIPIQVGAGALTPTPPPVTGPVGAREIVRVTEITPLQANSLRLEIITGTGINHVWIPIVRGAVTHWHHQQAPVSQDANSRTWHVTISPPPARNTTITVWGNAEYITPGATQRSHVVQQEHVFANPLITAASASPTQVMPGTTTTISVSTNHEVNFVWAVVDGVRRNAVRTNPGAPATAIRTWRIDHVAPAATGLITIHANATDTPTGAATRTVWVESLLTSVQLIDAHASWVPRDGDPHRDVRIAVTTSVMATRVNMTAGGITRALNLISTNTHNNTRHWELVLQNNGEFSHHAPIHIEANDLDHWLIGSGVPVTGFINGVGGSFHLGGGQGHQTHGILLHHSLQAFRSHDIVHLTGNLITNAEVTALRIRNNLTAAIVGSQIDHFTHDANNNRTWTIPGSWVLLHTGGHLNLTVEFQRAGSTAWHPITPALTLPVF